MGRDERSLSQYAAPLRARDDGTRSRSPAERTRASRLDGMRPRWLRTHRSAGRCRRPPMSSASMPTWAGPGCQLCRRRRRRRSDYTHWSCARRVRRTAGRTGGVKPSPDARTWWPRLIRLRLSLRRAGARRCRRDSRTGRHRWQFQCRGSRDRHRARQRTTRAGSASGYEFLLHEGGRAPARLCLLRTDPGTVARYDVYWVVVDPRNKDRASAACSSPPSN